MEINNREILITSCIIAYFMEDDLLIDIEEAGESIYPFSKEEFLDFREKIIATPTIKLWSKSDKYHWMKKRFITIIQNRD